MSYQPHDIRCTKPKQPCRTSFSGLFSDCKLTTYFLTSLDRLPRRESERRNHPLIRHCDVLTAIETRISLLQMTFMKYVDAEACCFIPGKVIDELFEVLRKISATDAEIPRSYEVLQAGNFERLLWRWWTLNTLEPC